MAARIAAAIVAAVLVFAFMSPVVLKIRDVALLAVVLVGVVMMLIDLWQTLRSERG